MSHIHTKPSQYDFTASALIIRIDLDEPKAILHMHKKLHRYLQFGGHVELYENPWQTVVHEIREESGYDLDQLTVLQPKIRLSNGGNDILHPVPASLQSHKFGTLDHYHTDISFAFVTDQPPRHKPDAEESDHIVLFSYTELQVLLPAQIPENVRQNFWFVMNTCLKEWQRIPAIDFAV